MRTPLPQKTPLVIGLTGPIGSGVSTVSKILGENSFHRLRISEHIRKALADSLKLGSVAELAAVPHQRAAMQDMGDKMRKEKGLGYWVDMALSEVPESDPDLVIDGIRNLGEVERLRELYPKFYLAAVVATRETRWGRMKGVYNENQREFNEDDERDADEELKYGQQVDQCVQEADFVLLNEEWLGTSTVRGQNLLGRLQPTIELMRGKQVRGPTPEETHMATAYAQSYRSQCLKRYVGAVIVGDNGVSLSIGYNENPVGMDPCKIGLGYCYKDYKMEENLERREKVYCPNCGQENKGVTEPWLCGRCGKSLKKLLFPSRNIELCTALHAEERAIRSLPGGVAEGATMYVTTFPCLQCARYIVDARLARVVYVEAYPVAEAAEYLSKNSVVVDPFQGFKARSFNRVFRPMR